MLRRLILLCATIAAAQETDGPVIFRPTDKSVVARGPLSIVARAAGPATLALDGVQLSAEQKAPNVITATVKAADGPHELVLKSGTFEQKVRFSVGPQPTFRAHPPAAPCETCHAVQDGRWEMKHISLSTACFGCHVEKEFEPKHTHNPGVLADCQLCHAVHGSTATKHLKMAKAKACKQCHN